MHTIVPLSPTIVQLWLTGGTSVCTSEVLCTDRQIPAPPLPVVRYLPWYRCVTGMHTIVRGTPGEHRYPGYPGTGTNLFTIVPLHCSTIVVNVWFYNCCITNCRNPVTTIDNCSKLYRVGTLIFFNGTIVNGYHGTLNRVQLYSVLVPGYPGAGVVPVISVYNFKIVCIPCTGTRLPTIVLCYEHYNCTVWTLTLVV